jgi:hypothetical protein
MKKQEKKNCKCCQSAFIPKKSTTETCGPKCSKKFSIIKKRVLVIKTCKSCNKEFSGGRADKIFCCKNCVGIHHKSSLKYKAQRKIYYKKYREDNKQILAAKKAKYQKENWDQRKSYHLNWRTRNIEKIRAKREANKEFINERDRQKKAEYARRAREELLKSYLISIIKQGKNIKNSDIPDAMVDAYRTKLKFNRLITQISKNNENEKN